VTKQELIKLLEPFHDDIKIVVKSKYDSDILEPAEAEYKVAVGYTITGLGLHLDVGEGYIVIE
jgi:hypothetical protein